MGWLSMQTLGGHATPKAYLDAQFTYNRPDHTSRVLKSALRGKVWYAAVEYESRDVTTEAQNRLVYAAICLIRLNPRAADGYIFAYKSMDESVGPFAYDCPSGILDLLTPTQYPHARQWRDTCRALGLRKAAVRTNPPQPGDLISFDDPKHRDAAGDHRQFRVVAFTQYPRKLFFRLESTGQIFRIRDWKSSLFEVSRSHEAAHAIETQSPECHA